MDQLHPLLAPRGDRTQRRDVQTDAPPCLLDRLTARRSPLAHAASSGAARAQLRDAVLRDLGWLMHCENLTSTDDLAAFPHVRRSVLNFGVGGLAGVRAVDADWRTIEADVREAILRFEPRVVADSIEVRCVVGREATSQRQNRSLEILGQLWPRHASHAFTLRIDLDPESGGLAPGLGGGT
ncbi:GPW/gp25 family protein [Paraburkholderia sp.]|uniref:type VI secretion system baseplate subunit TssE n=1 Tax=Paraburkholderia sp. TaxID=1926495 RepID=UPI002397604C|nr:GPW/gp25 family protein [Paraburkholderia sp.]MDE1183232.1 GPW/gp25 family protein [Paraburkholderia sp.]